MPCLLAVLSAVFMRMELRSKGTDQYLVGIGVDVNLFPSQSDGQVGGMGGQFAAGPLGGGAVFLLGRQHPFPNIFPRGFAEPPSPRSPSPFPFAPPFSPFPLP